MEVAFAHSDGHPAMGLRERVAQGIQAGLLAGVSVAVVFFVADVVRFSPLSTPAALGQSFIGPGGTFIGLPVETRVAALVSSGIRLVSFTILHFLAFSVLGVGAAVALRGRALGACVVSGACYGLVACSAAFYGSVVLTGAHLVAEAPGLLAVIGANVLAGMVMGVYLGLGAPAD